MEVIVDGLDSFKTRMIVNEEAYGQGIPYVFAGSVGWSANATTFTFEEETPCLECLFEGVNDDELPQCESAGVHPSILGIIASVEVAETVRLLLGQEARLVNKLLFVDLKELTFDKLQIAPRKDCEVCLGGKGEAGYLIKSGKEEVRKMSINEEEYNITELCGRATFVVSAKKSPNWDFGKVIEKLRKKYKKISAFGTAAVTVFYSEEPKVEISIVKGGTVTIKGLEEREKALKVFKEVISIHLTRK
jgi:adenylyltransferase/sulfurtransferase